MNLLVKDHEVTEAEKLRRKSCKKLKVRFRLRVIVQKRVPSCLSRINTTIHIENYRVTPRNKLSSVMLKC